MSRRTTSWAAVIVTAASASAQPTDDVHHWACPDGGVLDDAGCWLEGESPVPDGIALFDLPGEYGVEIVEDGRVDRLLVRDGCVTFDGSGVIAQRISTAEPSVVVGGAPAAAVKVRRSLLGWSVVLGDEPDRYGEIEVSAAVPTGVVTLNARSELLVGAAGGGRLIAVGGLITLVKAGKLVVGRDRGSAGTVELHAAHCDILSGNAIIGDRGTAFVEILAGSSLDSPLVHVGLHKTATGFVSVRGAGSRMEAGGLVVGVAGFGSLAISDQASVESAYSTVIGAAGDRGMIGVRDAGSVLSVGLDLYLGQDGSGSLELAGGGRAIVGGDLRRSDTPTSVLIVRLASSGDYAANPALLVAGGTPPQLPTRVELEPGYTPAAGDTFLLIEAGQLDSVLLVFNNADATVHWTTSITDHELRITATAPDIDGDGNVDADDLVAVILAWGTCPEPPDDCPADVNGDGAVDADDLVGVILAWTG